MRGVQPPDVRLYRTADLEQTASVQLDSGFGHPIWIDGTHVAVAVYATVARNGYIWQAALATHVSFRDYGEMTNTPSVGIASLNGHGEACTTRTTRPSTFCGPRNSGHTWRSRPDQLHAVNGKLAYGAALSAKLDLSRPDATQPGLLLGIIAHNHGI